MLLPKKTWIICRVCLKQQEVLHDIFEKIASFQIWISLRDCGGVPVRKNDDLPDKICEQCLLHLWESYKFRLEVQRGHSEITHILAERNYNIYEQELEEERKASSDIVKPSESKLKNDPLKHEPKLNTNTSPQMDQIKLKASNNTESTDKEFVTIKPPDAIKSMNQLEETKEFVTIKPTDTIKSLNQSEETETIEIANGPIKQYCIVKRKDLLKEQGKNKDKSFENDEQKRIILLLKLKNATKTKGKLKAATKSKAVTQKRKSQTEVKPKTERKTKSNKHPLCKKENDFTCKICKKSYDTYTLLRHHNYTHKNPYQCKICGKTFSQSQALLSHLNTHSGDKPFNCRICNVRYTDQSNRNRHERNEHGEENKKFQCQKCDRKFRFLWMLEKHANVHRSTKCSICGRVLATATILRSHLQRIHLKKENKPIKTEC